MKKIKIASILLISAASFTACQKESLMQPAELNATELTDAAKVVKKPYINTIADINGNVMQTFVYNVNSVLTDIRLAGNINQHFNYSPAGQLVSIAFIDNTGLIFRTIDFSYGSNPALPDIAKVFAIDNSGQLNQESEVVFNWDSKGNKTNEVTKIIASGTVTEQRYTYLNGNLITNEYLESGVVLSTIIYSQFDTYKSPFRNNTILKLIPGFEFQNHNMQMIKSDKGGVSMIEQNTITYNGNNLPIEIVTSSSFGVTKHLLYTYIKQ